MNRRDFLCRSGINAAAVSSLGSVALANNPQPVAQPVHPFKPGKAKSIIQIWLWGGPPHLDTFDPKPDAGPDYCGIWSKPIDTAAEGMKISQGLPLLAAQADKFSIIRSMAHNNNGHEQACYIVQTGRNPDSGISYPNIGAIVSLFKGTKEAGYNSPLPPYIVLTRGQGRFSESGFLGPKYKPFVTGGNPNTDPFLVSGFVVRGLTPERQQIRREMLNQLDAMAATDPSNPAYGQTDEAVNHAYDLIQGDAVKTFNLATEDPAMREKYGRNEFGQSCLAARRLVEAGVPYITINSGGWDMHGKIFDALARRLPEVDKGVAALIEDLAKRNLLDSTIIWMCGEFGRTPKIDNNAPWFGGRHHFGNCYSVLVAGGGFKGGKIVGSSDEFGNKPVERPVKPHDLLGSMLEMMGINPDDKLPNARGYDVTIQPPESEHGRLREIIT